MKSAKEVSFYLESSDNDGHEEESFPRDTASSTCTSDIGGFADESDSKPRRKKVARLNYQFLRRNAASDGNFNSKGSKSFTNMGKQKRSASEAVVKFRPSRDKTGDKKDKDDSNKTSQRRSTEGDVTRDAIKRNVTAPAYSGWNRRSLGAIFKDNDKNKTAQLLNMAVKHEIQRRNLMAKFRFAIRLRILMLRWWRRHSVAEVSQTHPFYMQFRMINDEEPPDSALNFKASYFKANKQMKMSQEAVRILTMDPELRTKEDVHYAIIALRSIDCIADYPLRMQEALATHGMFQSFGAKRIIVKQGHSPIYFYFILYGTVVVATLDSGEPYAKTRVTLRRGENFGAEELAIAHRIPRQSTVLTMEYTEFLTIDCDTYENIFMAGGVKTIHDPDHNKFMRSLYFLKNWSQEKLQSATKAMEFCYFRRNTVMVKDSNCSDWIYIVKSGSLRVYKKLKKCYPSVNKRTGNYTEHALVNGYECFMSQESEFHRYAMYNNISLPPPLCPESDSDDDEQTFYKYKSSVDEKENLLALPLMQRVERLIRPRTAEGGVIATYGHSKYERRKRITSAKSERPRPSRVLSPSKASTPRTISSFSNTTMDLGFDMSSATPEVEEHNEKRTLMDDWESSTKGKRANADHVKRLNSSERVLPRPGDVNPNAISTRHSVFVTDITKKEITAADLDPEFVLVQTLTKGQAFGVQQALLEQQPSLILVSGGAECVMLNKKFFKENIDPNTIQNLKQQISPYPTDEELQQNLQIRVNWLRYRQITLDNLRTAQTDGRPPKLKYKNKALVFK